MSREWNPGDVAMVTKSNGNTTPAVRTRDHKGTDLWVAIGIDHWITDGPHITARPLVVIDPEDAEQVSRLCSLLGKHHGAHSAVDLDLDFVSSQAALREFADPKPRIEEPRGLGAVVRDSSGLKWIRVTNTPGTFPWLRDGYGVEGWSNIDAVEVLSEGVTS